MICKKCGSNVIVGSKFCMNCGASIEEVSNNQIVQEQTNQNTVLNNNIDANNLNQSHMQGDTNNSNLNNNFKKDNKKLIILFSIIGGLVLLGVVITLIMFSLIPNKDTINDSNSNYEENTNDVEVEESGKRIGTEEFGYVTVPDNWVRFYDVDGSSTYQYSYAGIWIVTLYAVPKTQIDAKSYASNVRYAMEYEEGATNVTGATVTLGKYNAYQVYGYYPDDNVWLVSWYFEAEDGKTHYLSIEGPDRYSDNFNIANTFSLEK